jgi:hypothetical protein
VDSNGLARSRRNEGHRNHAMAAIRECSFKPNTHQGVDPAWTWYYGDACAVARRPELPIEYMRNQRWFTFTRSFSGIFCRWMGRRSDRVKTRVSSTRANLSRTDNWRLEDNLEQSTGASKGIQSHWKDAKAPVLARSNCPVVVALAVATLYQSSIRNSWNAIK